MPRPVKKMWLGLLGEHKKHEKTVLQGSVANHLRCGGILNNRFIANCIESVPVKEF